MEKKLRTITIDGWNTKDEVLQTKYGVRYKVGIKTVNQEGQEFWLNGLMSQKPNFAKGQQIELEVWNDDKWGWQFNVPKNKETSTTPQPTYQPPSQASEIASLRDLMEKVLYEVQMTKSILMGKTEVSQKEVTEQAVEMFGGDVMKDDKPNEIDVNKLPDDFDKMPNKF